MDLQKESLEIKKEQRDLFKVFARKNGAK